MFHIFNLRKYNNNNNNNNKNIYYYYYYIKFPIKIDKLQKKM